MYPADLRYTSEHEWARVAGDVARVGITEFAQAQLGDVVYVDLTKKTGDRVEASESFGVVESVKAASDLYCPLSGVVLSVNAKLAASPELVNQDPYGDGWMLEMRISDPAQVGTLLSSEDYEAQLPKD
jgi:glycine cleavage system H protein